MRDRLAPFVLCLVIGLNAIRFIGLGTSPPGFYTDESSNAMHMVCMEQMGQNALGESFPLFTNQFEKEMQGGSGMVPPTHLYLGALWSMVFGGSVESLRALSAALMALAVWGIYLLARLWAGKEAALYAALAASLSPWGFQVGRIAAMAALIPPLLAFCLYFFFRSNRGRDLLVSAVLAVLALYSYPTARVQAPLLLCAMLWLKHRQGKLAWKPLALPTLVSGVLLIPLFLNLVSPESLERINGVSIFSAKFLDRPEIHHDAFLVFGAFLKNFILHFSPDYLFLAGDHNLRHSTQAVGELSWLDSLAWLSGFVFLLPSTWRSRPLGPAACFGLFCVLGLVSGVVPASLTFEAVPHALRSVGAWIFVPLLTGLALSRLRPQLRALPYAAIALSLVFSGYFFGYYFARYPEISKSAWDTVVKLEAERDAQNYNWAPFGRLTLLYPAVSARYYLVEYGHDTCLSSEAHIREIRSQARMTVHSSRQ